MALAKLGVVVLDCPDPRALAAFYAGVLGGTVEGDGDWVDLKVPGGQSLAFQAAPGHVHQIQHHSHRTDKREAR
jgi:hypothetical protein